jgi:glycosyltransferase involved in cell wall biosynthesis
MVMKKISIIIPTKNEEEGIAKVLCSIPEKVRKKAEIIVVDSSKDMTPIIAERLGAKVIRVKRKGKGYAMKIGAKAAKGRILVFMDGDSTDPPSYIPKLIEKLKKYDIVLGARSLKSRGSEKKYKLIFSLYIPIVKAFFKMLGFKIRGDPLAGFRAMKKDVWEKLELKSNDFRIETEMNIKAIEKGFKVGEISIPILSRSGGLLKSKLVKSFDQWIKIFDYGIAYMKNQKIKNQLITLKNKFLHKYRKIFS